jgi:hypothetical protein
MFGTNLATGKRHSCLGSARSMLYVRIVEVTLHEVRKCLQRTVLCRFSYTETNVKWVPCHQGTARLQECGWGNSLHGMSSNMIVSNVEL